MTNQELYQECYEKAKRITAAHREGITSDPQGAIATATALIIVAITAVVGSIAGGVVSAVGYSQAARAAKDAANFNEAVAANNASSARQQAQFDADRIRDRNRRIISTQRVGFAKSGIDPDSGTAADVRADSAVQGELEALMAIYSGQTGAQRYHNEGTLARMRGESAQRAAPYNMAGSVLSGVTGAASVGSSAFAASSNPSFAASSNPSFKEP